MNEHALLSSRRRLLLGVVGAGVAALSAGGSRANPLTASSGLALPERYADRSSSEQFWAQPRVVNLLRQGTGEHVRVCYWRDGRLDPDGYRRACHLLRDVRAGKATAMDLGLLNMHFAAASWLRAAYGFDEPFLVTSGYRTEVTNANTEGAVKNSQHTLGKAIDGRYVHLPAEYVGRFFASFRAGGVGFYLNTKRNFIHIDTGRVRFWTGK
ncbi:YcbK family protein [Xanthomonas euvesicatoria]